MSPIFLRDAVNFKVLHELSKLLLALCNILLTNVSGQVEFYTPVEQVKKKIQTHLFLFSNKMFVFRAVIHNILVRITNRHDHHQTASPEAV